MPARRKKLAALTPGQKSDPPADPAYYRERGQVADFIRCDGRLWRYLGADPLQATTLIRKSVLKEFKPQLDAIRAKLAEPQIYVPGS